MKAHFSWKTLNSVFMERNSKTTTALIYMLYLEWEAPILAMG